MKVKHWAGYGSVEARCLRRSPREVVIELCGNHERGLDPMYFTTYDWYRWLGKRFHIGEFKRVETRCIWNGDTEAMQVRFIREA